MRAIGQALVFLGGVGLLAAHLVLFFDSEVASGLMVLGGILWLVAEVRARRQK